MLKKLMLLSLTISSVANLQAMGLVDKTATQVDTKKEYDAKATKDLKQFVEQYRILKANANSEQLAQQLKDIIARGADVNAIIENTHDESVLLYAALSEISDPSFYQILLENNASPHAQSTVGQTARQLMINQSFWLSDEYLSDESYKETLNNYRTIISMLEKAEQPPVAPPAPMPEVNMAAGATPQSSQTSSTSKE